MTLLLACSGGGGDIPNTEPKPDPKPDTEKPTVTISSGSDTTPVFKADGGESVVSFTASDAWTVSVTNNRADSWLSVNPTSGEKGEATITITTTPNDTYDERNATVTIQCGTASKPIVVSQKQLDALLVTSNKCEVGADGGIIQIEVKANVKYKVEVKADWIKKVESRGLSSTMLEFNVDKNPTDDTRQGEIVISDGTLTETVKVYQGYHEFITLTQREFDVPSDGGIIDVEIKSTVDYEMTVLEGEDWISEDISRAASTHTHHIIVAPNETYELRQALLVFADKKNAALADTVTIRQTYMGAILIADSEYEINIGGGELDFKVQANVDIEIIVDVDWIKQMESRGMTEYAFSFIVEENQDNNGREGTITVKEIDGNLTQTIKVKQKGLDDIPYLKFEAEAEQTFTMSQAVATLEYSVNGGEWKELGTNTVVFGGDNGALRLRGNSLNGTASDIWNISTISFGTEIDVCCSGDIRTLLDYNNYGIVSTANARFIRLFGDCYQLVSTPDLPAIDLAERCYNDMFVNCTGLTEAPALPATILAETCYCGMFLGCTSLTTAPELPATTLAHNCYSGMFSGCTSLTTTPELPATTLADGCYGSMFYGCTSLTTTTTLPAMDLAECCYEYMFNGCIRLTETPVLPATTLAGNCYWGMFEGCVGLIVAPELPATSLAQGCYVYMLGGCANLKNAPELPATTLAYNCYFAMFYGCTSLIKAPELPATTLAEYCYGAMFSDCTNLTEVPELPATTLADACYCGMFSGCTNLTEVPELPAITLTKHCYEEMFSDCMNLTEVPELPATALANNCYLGMFRRCANLTTAPELPAITLAERCYEGMFSGCTSLTTAPELPATTLAYQCYDGMFSGCTGLIDAPALPALDLAVCCYIDMFIGCTNLEVAPKLPAPKLIMSCYSSMFSGCTNLNNVTMLATDISDSSCLNGWLEGVSPTGTFIKAKEMSSLTLGSSGVPEGWSVVNYEE